MMPTGFDYPEWLDIDAEELKLKSNAPEKVQNAFKTWISQFKTSFVDDPNIVDGIKIEDLL